MVEFAIILPVFLLIVFGVIQFGLALNYWLDMQRIANQGARWAAVDRWPGACASGVCTGNQALKTYLGKEWLANSAAPGIKICFLDVDGDTNRSEVGDAVQVRLRRQFNAFPIVNLNLNLKANATMRIERPPTRYAEDCPA